MKFIVFEGLDGAGKSTLMARLKTELEKTLVPVILTREPGGTALGEEVRQILLRTQGEAPVERAELLLYEAGRAQHVDQIIRPALDKNKWVLCDRFSASTVAFQVGGRGLSIEHVNYLNAYAENGITPHLYVLLDLSTAEAQKRMQGRDLDRFEKEAQDFHERVRSSYLELAQKNPTQWLVLDARQTLDELFIQLKNHLIKRGWLK